MGTAAFFSLGAAAAQNPDNTYEPLGFGADGAMTLITTGAANTKGSYVQLGGAVTVAAWSDLVLFVSTSNTGALRVLIDLRVNGGAPILTNLFLFPGTIGSGPARVPIPIPVPAAASIEVRAQAATATGTIKVAVLGTVAAAGAPPGYTTSDTVIAGDTAATRPNTIDVPLVASGSTTFTQLVASTSAAYGAFLLTVSDNGTTPAASQTAVLDFAVGASGSEVIIGTAMLTILAGAPATPRAIYGLFNKSVASGQRLSVRIRAATPGTDNLRIGVHGYR